MTSAPAHDDPFAPARSALYAGLIAWLVLAALAQIIFIAHWPLYVLGQPIPWPGAVVVAAIRLGVYTGLAWGILHREQAAWAGTVLELARTFLIFIAIGTMREGLLIGDVYPAAWLQGLLAGALPLVWLINGLMAGGWRPHPALDVASFARVLAAAAGIGAIWLRRREEDYGVPATAQWRVLFGKGLPVVLVLSLAEGLAWFLAVGAFVR